MRARVKALAHETKTWEKSLSAEAREAMMQVNARIRNAVLSEAEKERVCHDICQMLAVGESEGRRVRDIIGTDVAAFCRSVIGELPPLDNKRRFLAMLRNTLPILLGIFLWVVVVEGHTTTGEGLRFVISKGALFNLLLCLAVWGSVQWLYVKQAAMRFWKAWTAAFFILAGLAVIGEWLARLYPEVIAIVPVWPVLLIVAALAIGTFLAHRALNRK